MLEVLMLGSGTSTGVPQIACQCAVCTSADPRNRRSRPGIALFYGGRTVLIDTPPDHREQALRFGLQRVDAVLFTHAHADHIFGLDDLRIYNFRQGGSIPCYGSNETLAALRRTFAYVFEETQAGGGKPQLDLLETDGEFELFGRRIEPLPVWHGALSVLGFRLGSFAYVTDTNRIPESTFERLGGLDVLILDGLRQRPHPTHFHFEAALEAAERIGAKKTFFTHLTHDVDHGAPGISLPPSVELGYDGLRISVP